MTSFANDNAARLKPPGPGFQPTRVLEVELSRPLPALHVESERGYRRALALVRLHTQPLGLMELQLTEAGLGAVECASEIWRALGPEINAHLQQDGLPQAGALTAAGLPRLNAPPCLRERECVLACAPSASVVVATRDRTESLADALRSLLAQDYPRYEIIVVDNAPRANTTADFIRQGYGNSPLVRYVREDRPGLAAAHNSGLARLQSEIVAFTDDDVRADRHWLAELVKGFAAADNVGCVTGMIVPAELDTPAQMWLEQFGGFTKGFSRRLVNMADHRPPDPLYPYAAGRFGSGANMAFKTSVLRALGGFDPATGAGTPALGGDDLAAFFQVVTQGYTLAYEPGAIIYHRHCRNYAGLRRQAYGYGVGLTAYLTKSLLDNPGLLLDFAAKIPAGLVYALSPHSPKNQKKQADYPKELTAVERRGMLYGPVAYLRSRWQAMQWDKKNQALPLGASPNLVDESTSP